VRIGLFHATLPKAGRKTGGVEAMVHRLADQLVARGHDISVLSFTAPPPGASYRHRRLGPAWVARSTPARMFLVPLLLNRLEVDGVDVLHLHGDDWFYVRRRVPTVRTLHGSALSEARHSTRWLRRARQLFTYPLEALSSRLATERTG
jgi:glycosyltransferase involved in cell wall biosynthesis